MIKPILYDDGGDVVPPKELPEAPQPVMKPVPEPAPFYTYQKPEEKPKFWTPERKAETGALAIESAIDGYTTQKLGEHGYHEANPIARPLVNRGTAGQVIASTAGPAMVLGAQYLAHKLGHDKLANYLGRTAVAGEGLNVGRQIDLLHKAPGFGRGK